MRQRLAVLVIAIVGGMLLTSATATAHAPDGADGVTLLLAGSPVMAILGVLAIGAVVALLASGVGTLGNPIVGVFTLGVAMTVAAVYGGTIDGTLRSSGESSVYWALTGETIVWMVVMAALVTVCIAAARRLRCVCPWCRAEPGDEPEKGDAESRNAHQVARRRFEAMDMFHATSGSPYVAGGVGQAVVESIVPTDSPRRGWVQMGLCTLVAVVIGGGVASLLLRSEDTGQVVGGLVGAMLIGGVIGHRLFPTRSALPAVLAPGLVGVIGHVWAAVSQPTGEAFLGGYFAGELSGAALALPVYFLSAGLAGTAMGIGWSQAMMVDRYGMGEDEEIPEPHVEPEV